MGHLKPSFLVVLALAVVLAVSPAYAVQVQFDNSDDHLADFLNVVEPSLNPYTGQLSLPGNFAANTGTADSSKFFINVGAAFSTTTTLGLYFPSLSLTVQLWDSSDPYSYYWNGSSIVNTGNSSSVLLNFTGGNLIVTKTDTVSGTPTTTTATYNGVPLGTAFDVYLNPGANNGGPWYSDPSLNGGYTQALFFPDGSGGYYLAFEDLQSSVTSSYAGGPLSGGNAGFGDAVIGLESVTPVPEPASLLLLGSGLISLGAATAWRRKQTA